MYTMGGIERSQEIKFQHKAFSMEKRWYFNEIDVLAQLPKGEQAFLFQKYLKQKFQ